MPVDLGGDHHVLSSVILGTVSFQGGSTRENPLRQEASMEVMGTITESIQGDAGKKLAEFVSKYAKEVQFSPEEVTAVGIAMEEVVGNIIHWAYGSGESGEIAVSCSADDNGNLYVTVEDWGKPFNMPLADVFPDVWDPDGSQERPSMKRIKKAFKNVEYKRDQSKNILVLIAMQVLAKTFR
jgi:anti-sigma regulatory factor (Ser/Thr protein kinase)